eukprot:1442525-Rhodomonas_salina.3
MPVANLVPDDAFVQHKQSFWAVILMVTFRVSDKNLVEAVHPLPEQRDCFACPLIAARVETTGCAKRQATTELFAAFEDECRCEAFCPGTRDAMHGIDAMHGQSRCPRMASTCTAVAFHLSS